MAEYTELKYLHAVTTGFNVDYALLSEIIDNTRNIEYLGAISTVDDRNSLVNKHKNRYVFDLTSTAGELLLRIFLAQEKGDAILTASLETEFNEIKTIIDRLSHELKREEAI